MNNEAEVAPRPSVGEVFRVFLKLGLTSFGGPVAHLGYFRTEFVERRAWMDDREYADLVTLSQFLPGPASSQVGFGIGLVRAGGWGAIAAFVAFTLPSAVLMIAFAYGATLVSGPIGEGVVSGLKIVAVAIVAQAVWGMARTLTPDARRAGIAALALVCAAMVAGSGGQILAITIGVIGGLVLCRAPTGPQSEMIRFPVSRTAGYVSLTVLVVLLLGGPLIVLVTGNGPLALFDIFARAGALVFGGGHVVLPLLQAGLVDPGWVSEAEFLSGYGVAQAMPGPLFSIAGYLGAIADIGPGGLWGAMIALVGIFLPGFLLLIGVLPFWNTLCRRAAAQAAMRGANAAVVGILAAALYSPVFTTAVTGVAAFCLAAVCFVFLTAFRLPPWLVVIAGSVGGVLIGLL
ncbi:chromate efflux transporter [Microbacterium memoriense]|uniref:Chromate efflux transporter n=1 Tax=Microbacterium memoriense TaxID=2978350 RepID=A0ABT2P876_9MICO|nr:chromate efflux transporter [Microbacterium memoriense]MCT9000882.1 chromate efflux transporter [Microbacterium memoriense]